MLGTAWCDLSPISSERVTYDEDVAGIQKGHFDFEIYILDETFIILLFYDQVVDVSGM